MLMEGRILTAFPSEEEDGSCAYGSSIHAVAEKNPSPNSVMD